MKLKLPTLSLNRIIIIAIIICTLLKISLVNRGFLFLPDEGRYTQSGKALQALSQGNIGDAVTFIHSIQGRPFSAILHMIPSALQFITAGSTESSEIFSPQNSFWIFIYNFIIYCLILYMLYKIVRHYSNETYALFAVLIYGCLDSSFIYLRHALCYESALLLFLYVQYCITLNQKSPFLIGILNASAYLIYPGYILLFIFNGLFIVFQAFKQNKFIYKSFIFTLGILATFVFEELFSRLGKIYFLDSSITLSGTVKLGDFEDTFKFLYQFLTEVEGLRGYGLILTFILFPALLSLKKNTYSNDTKLELMFMFGTSIFLYCLYAFNGYYLRNSVYYARITHQFIPLLVLIYTISIYSLKQPKLIIMLGVVYIAFYIPAIVSFAKLVYPKDMEYNYPVQSRILKHYEYQQKFYTVNHRKIEYNSKDSLQLKLNELNTIKSKTYLTLNQAFYLPTDTLFYYKKFEIPQDFTLISDYPHPIQYIGYQFEGHNAQSREYLKTFNFRLSVYQKN